jgi:hypothetical protein
MPTAREQIRNAMKAYGLYPEEEVNACRVYKDHEGWHIGKFGKGSWNAGGTVAQVISNIRIVVESRKDVSR